MAILFTKCQTISLTALDFGKRKGKQDVVKPQQKPPIS